MLKYFTVVLIGLALMLVATPASAQEGGDGAAAAASGGVLFGSSLGVGLVMVRKVAALSRSELQPCRDSRCPFRFWRYCW